MYMYMYIRRVNYKLEINFAGRRFHLFRNSNLGGSVVEGGRERARETTREGH